MGEEKKSFGGLVVPMKSCRIYVTTYHKLQNVGRRHYAKIVRYKMLVGTKDGSEKKRYWEKLERQARRGCDARHRGKTSRL